MKYVAAKSRAIPIRDAFLPKRNAGSWIAGGWFALTVVSFQFCEGGEKREKRRILVRRFHACTLPEARSQSYCNTDKGLQVALTVIGADCAAGTWKCRTPSSVEQKSRTPVWLNTAAEVPIV